MWRRGIQPIAHLSSLCHERRSAAVRSPQAGTILKIHSEGFTLIELLIVVSIILIISAIAIPNLLRSRIAANEAATVANMRTLNSALITYAAAYPAFGFPSSLISLGPAGAGIPSPNAADLVDSTLAQQNPVRSGYQYSYSATTGSGGGGGGSGANTLTNYTLIAAPISQNGTGIRTFFANQTALIHACDPGQAVDLNCPMVQ